LIFIVIKTYMDEEKKNYFFSFKSLNFQVKTLFQIAAHDGYI